MVILGTVRSLELQGCTLDHSHRVIELVDNSSFLTDEPQSSTRPTAHAIVWRCSHRQSLVNC